MNLKKLVAAVSLLTVSVPATLSVVACGCKQPEKKSDTNSDEIIKSINKITNLEINITSQEEDKIKVLDVLKDPKLGLSEAINKQNIKNFKKDSFKVDTITTDKEGKNKIKDDALITSDTTYYFNYTYNDKPSKDFVEVKIVNTEKTVIEGINKTEFKTSAVAGSKAEDFIKTINKEFIETKLNPEIKKIFNKDSLEIKQINNVDGKKISDDDLETVKTVKAKIVYTYAKNEGQADLTITVTQNETDQKIVDAISKITYEKSIESNSKVEDLNINGDFIKTQLNPELQKEFKTDSFQVAKLTKEDNVNLIIDNDLVNSGTINGKIHYNYGTIKNQSTNLTIKVTVSKTEIVDTITNAKYSLEFKDSTTVEAIKAELTPKFIKESLKDNIKTEFKDDKFKLNKIIKNGEELSDEDLKNPGTFEVQFSFTYDGTNATNNNLTITITEE